MSAFFFHMSPHTSYPLSHAFTNLLCYRRFNIIARGKTGGYLFHKHIRKAGGKIAITSCVYSRVDVYCCTSWGGKQNRLCRYFSKHVFIYLRLAYYSGTTLRSFFYHVFEYHDQSRTFELSPVAQVREGTSTYIASSVEIHTSAIAHIIYGLSHRLNIQAENGTIKRVVHGKRRSLKVD